MDLLFLKEKDELKEVVDQYIQEANQSFIALREKIYADVYLFWYRNTDENGERCLERKENGKHQDFTGIEILQKMGTDARSIMLIAYRRVEMLLAIQADLGLEGLVDISKCIAPYDITYNEDGSFKSATLR